MTAETLRRAAQVLRERAEKATPGPWTVDVIDTRTRVRGGQHGVSSVADTGDPEYPGANADAALIATMHPGVGLALAKWLDEAGADLWARGLHCAEGCAECDDDLHAPHVRHALVVADAILGEDR